MKIRRVVAELFHADRRRDMTKLLVAFAFLRTHLKQPSTEHITQATGGTNIVVACHAMGTWLEIIIIISTHNNNNNNNNKHT
jgi:hypothetical protein